MSFLDEHHTPVLDVIYLQLLHWYAEYHVLSLSLIITNLLPNALFTENQTCSLKKSDTADY